MKSIFIILFSLYIGLGVIKLSSTENYNFDFSSIDNFWKLIPKLEKDISPDQEEWDALFNTPGYAEFTKKEFPKEWLKDYITLAIMPSKNSKAIEWKEKGYYDYKFVKHFRDVVKNKEISNRFADELKSDNYLIENSIEMTKVYLPDGYEVGSYPPISFIFFDNDARGYSPILVDLLYASKQGQNLRYLIAHEAHHYYRNKLLIIENPNQKTPDSKILWVLNQIQAEGIADQIDKRITYFDGGYMEESEWALKYKEYLDDTPNLIIKLDELLSEYNFNDSNKAEIADKFFGSVPMSGHPTGYFMSNVIIENLGKEKLVSCLANPFEFFRLYNKAVALCKYGYPEFSENSIELINELELKYSKKAE